MTSLVYVGCPDRLPSPAAALNPRILGHFEAERKKIARAGASAGIEESTRRALGSAGERP
jgi:hypothetical protein